MLNLYQYNIKTTYKITQVVKILDDSNGYCFFYKPIQLI